MNIGVYGGSFNPPHIGHVAIAKTASEKLNLDKLLIIPAGIPPHKAVGSDFSDSDVRMEMARLAFGNIRNAEISDIEIKREGKSYTADTLKELREVYPEDKIYLIMGTDMFLTLDFWYKPEEIIKEATPVAFARNEGDLSLIYEKKNSLDAEFHTDSIVIETDVISISSTELRCSLSERKGLCYLPSDLYCYIIEHRLFGAKPSLSWLRYQAIGMLKPKRVPHVIGCEQEAEKLALRWGEDVTEAKEAAILHDITKKLEGEEQLSLCQKYDIILDALELDSPKLLHSKTGAEVAKEKFGISERVYNAIYRHTTGVPEMTLLDKIIYLADYVEPTRDFEGVEKLRALCYEDIDKAMYLGLAMSIEDLQARGLRAHKNSLNALKYYKKG